MSDVLYEHLTRKIPLTPDEYAFIREQFVPRQLKRKEVLLRAGDVCRVTAFVEKGILRAYSVDEKGAEHTTQFAFEGGWMGDMFSMLTGEPATITIEALEDADLLLLEPDAADRIYEQVPRFERYQRLLVQNHLVVVYRRLLNTMSSTAEEKYDQLLTLYPTIGQRVSQHIIASYLGITPEFLSRIRARKAGKAAGA